MGPSARRRKGRLTIEFYYMYYVYILLNQHLECHCRTRCFRVGDRNIYHKYYYAVTRGRTPRRNSLPRWSPRYGNRVKRTSECEKKKNCIRRDRRPEKSTAISIGIPLRPSVLPPRESPYPQRHTQDAMHHSPELCVFIIFFFFSFKYFLHANCIERILLMLPR